MRQLTTIAILLIAGGAFASPVIKTIKPAGGGDYTSLNAWWTDVYTNANPAQWAECYSGGDLGFPSAQSQQPTATATDTDYPRIYVPLSERHDGTTNKYCAYSTSIWDGAIPYLHIEGLEFTAQVMVGQAIRYGYTDVNVVSNVIDSCLFLGSVYMAWEIDGATAVQQLTFRNNVMYGYGLSISVAGIESGNITVKAIIENNSIANNSIYMDRITYMGGTASLTAYVSNNIVMDSPDGVEDYIRQGTITIAAGYNMSSDASATNYGGSGCITGVSSVTVFNDKSGDLRLRSISPARNTGSTLTGFNYDAVHTNKCRPTESAWDMGAIERQYYRRRSQ